jgi:transposase-like protein
MSEQRRIVKRYSAAFKQQLVGQIERGEISVAKAMQRYDIRGTTTIDRWLKQHGKHHLLATVVRIEMAEERDRIKALEEQVRTLERALAQTQIKSLALESVIESVDAEYGIDAKKNFGITPLLSVLSGAATR